MATNDKKLLSFSPRTRREVLVSAAAGLAGAMVTGFSPEARAWTTSASTMGTCETLPRLTGAIAVDDASRSAFATDLGLLEEQFPRAVLRPGSIDDIVAMVRFCRRHRITVAARGQGHATGGQALAEAGLIIDMKSLAAIPEVGDGWLVAEGGATWTQVLEQALPTGQTPPVLTGFVGLSVGGTLSMGGVNGMSYRHGAQVDHALELWVVTGKGELVVCSEASHSQLFFAVLGGVGQYGIIVRAKLRLIPAKARTLEWKTPYFDPALFFADMRTLLARGELDLIRGGVVLDPNSGAPMYVLDTAQFYDEGAPPDFTFLHRGLHLIPGATQPSDTSYFEFLYAVDGLVAFLRSIGQFEGHMHPWFDVFVPDPAAETYISETVQSLSPEDFGMFGQVLIFPIVPALTDRPLLRLPNCELAFLFDILTQADFPGYDAAYAAAMTARNRTLFDAARSIGGYRYPIGTLDFTEADWRQHYGPTWRQVRAAKAAYDPQRILTPGAKIF